MRGQTPDGMAYGATDGRDASYRLSHGRPMRCQALYQVCVIEKAVVLVVPWEEMHLMVSPKGAKHLPQL